MNDSRISKSRDNNVIDQDEEDALSDVYASEELAIKKKERFRKKKTGRKTQKLNNNKRIEAGKHRVNNHRTKT
jgi:hypothetical protein